MTPVWLEVHADDLLLAEDPRRWPDAAALLDRLAAAAEEEGGRLSFRIREAFATGDRHGFLRGLRDRGHEVGAHAHGRGLGRVVAALRRAGIAPTVVAPGFVQAGDRGRDRLLDESVRLGASTITDRLETRWFGYQGWLAWRPRPGLVSLDVSVHPRQWGITERRPDWAALTTLAERRLATRPPPGSSPFFGATFHEHDVCPPGSLDPRPLDGLRRFVARFRTVPSGTVGCAPEAASRGSPVPRRWLRRFAATGEIAVGRRRIRVRRVGPASPAGALAIVHGGGSGIAQGLDFLGLADDAFPDLAVWTFARTESFRTPGNPVHVADTRAVLERVLSEEVPVGVVSWSAGLVAALRALTGRERFLVDVEGPVDRWSLVPPGELHHELAGRDLWDDAAWAGLEAVAMARPLPYLRVQGAHDHVHGPHHHHARRMAEVMGGAIERCEGSVHEWPERWRRRIRGMFDGLS